MVEQSGLLLLSFKAWEITQVMSIRNPRNRTPGRGKAEWGQGGQVNSFLGEVGSRGYPGRTGSISADVEGARLGIGP